MLEINLEANDTENMRKNLTENQNYTLQCSIDTTNPLPSLSWTYTNISDTICNIDDAVGNFDVLRTSSSGNVSYTVPLATDDGEGCYLCVAHYLDANQKLLAVFLSVVMTSSDGKIRWFIAVDVAVIWCTFLQINFIAFDLWFGNNLSSLRIRSYWTTPNTKMRLKQRLHSAHIFDVKCYCSQAKAFDVLVQFQILYASGKRLFQI